MEFLLLILFLSLCGLAVFAWRIKTDQHRAIAAAQDEILHLKIALATAEETLKQERKQADEKLALLQESRESMAKDFKLLAEEVMAKHGQTFSQQNRQQVEGLLGPLKEKLVEFQQSLQNAWTDSAKERVRLAQQIRQLSDTSAKMSSETHNLTQALKGKSHIQGAWGEMILASLLERSGLREGEEYVTQENHISENGSRLRPDVIVNLPGGQRVVIDSKVSLVAFEACVNATDDAERAVQLARHLASIKNHIKTLSSKEYQTATGSGLDYVIMFVPIEGALALALQEDPGLSVYAAALNVAIATPNTLMMALKTVANVWHVQRRNKNAEMIAERAGKLYDKFAGFLEDMQDLGGRLDKARESYDGAMGKLVNGRANLIRQVEQLREMGAKTGKSLPSSLTDKADDASVPALEG